MQQIGALVVKQSVYVLPDSSAAREDFEWLKTEIEGAGGQASVFAAEAVDAWSTDALVDEFRRTREDAYAALAREADRILRQASRPGSRKTPAPRVVDQLRERLAAIERVDFFGSAGRDRVVSLVGDIETRLAARRRGGPREGAPQPPDDYRGRLWVTRPRPGVDRMASAWLIRRFIDPEARFGFVADRQAAPPKAIPFDMFGVEWTHQGDRCTFEVLCERFGLDSSALSAIAAIVHDLDLKDNRFKAPEAPAIGLVIDGLRLAEADDHQLLAEGMTLFEALHQAFERATRVRGPRPVAARRKRSPTPRARSPRR